MTTALATLSAGTIQLSDLERAILEEAGNDGAAYDPVPTKITISPGGTNILMTSDGEAVKSLTGIIVISQKTRAYWPEKGSGSTPLCSSPDGARGLLNPEPTEAQWRAAGTAKFPHPALPMLDNGEVLPPTFACAACPLAQFGSAHQGGQMGRSQACKAMRRLVVMVDGWAQPALFTLPPTSIKSFDVYASSLARQRSAYFAVRTTIKLEGQKSNSGDPYSVAAFSVAGKLGADELAAVVEVRRQFDSLVRTMPIDAAEYDAPAVNVAGHTMPDADLPPFDAVDDDPLADTLIKEIDALRRLKAAIPWDALDRLGGGI